MILPTIADLVTDTVQFAYHPEISDVRLISLSKAFDVEPPWCAKIGNVN